MVASPEPLGRPAAAGLSVLAGVMLAAAFPRLGWWPLAWLAFVPLLFALRGRRPRSALLWGWIAGAVGSMLGMSWIAGLIVRFAQQSWVVGVAAALLAGVAHGAALALACFLTSALWRRGLRPMVALPLSLVAAELVVPMVFPWQVGLSQQDVMGLIQISDILGARGISLFVALGGAALFELLSDGASRRTRWWAHGAAGVLAAVLAYGAVRIVQVREARSRAPGLMVGLVQAGLSISEKHDRDRFHINLALHQDLSAQLEREGAELVIWPESSYPFYVPREARRDQTGRNAVRRGFTVPVIFGAGSVDRERHRWNSAFLLDASGELIGPADKNELLIFGEYIPFYDDIELLQRSFPDAWNFTPGERPGVLEMGRLRAGVLNCYEDILPSLVRELAQRRPNLLVNITNDAWFGDTAEPHQHAAFARFRAVEHRVDLVRAVNSGVSGVIASTGEVLARTPVAGGTPRPERGPASPRRLQEPEFVRTTVLERVRLTEAGTVYTVIGDWWAWAVTVGLLAFLVLGRRRGPVQ